MSRLLVRTPEGKPMGEIAMAGQGLRGNSPFTQRVADQAMRRAGSAQAAYDSLNGYDNGYLIIGEPPPGANMSLGAQLGIELGWRYDPLEKRDRHGRWTREGSEPGKALSGVTFGEGRNYEHPPADRVAANGVKASDNAFIRKYGLSADHIVDAYDDSTPDERDQGMRWYSDAHDVARMLGGGDAGRGAALLATYSPQVDWATNVLNAAHAAAAGKSPGKGVGITASVAAKADEILGMPDGSNFDKLFPPTSAPKTRSFYRTIANGGDLPEDTLGEVVVDRHALSVAAGRRLTKDDTETPTYKEIREEHPDWSEEQVKAYRATKPEAPMGATYTYQHIADMYREAAMRVTEKYGTPVAPHQIQAITWLRQQRKNNEDEAKLIQMAEDVLKSGGKIGDVPGAKEAKGRAARVRNAWQSWGQYAKAHGVPVHVGTTAMSFTPGTIGAQLDLAFNPLEPRDSRGRWTRFPGSAEAAKVMEKEREGFSVSPRTGEAPASGYMVALEGHTHRYPASILDDPVKLRHAIDDLLMQERESFQGRDMFLGGWVEDGKLWLDPSQNVQDRSEAERLGRERDQVGIFDLNTFTTISTGGSGGGRIIDHQLAWPGEGPRDGPGGLLGPAGGRAAGRGGEDRGGHPGGIGAQLDLAGGWRDAWRHELRAPDGRWVHGIGAQLSEGIGSRLDKAWREEKDKRIKDWLDKANAYWSLPGDNVHKSAAGFVREAAAVAESSGDDEKAARLRALAGGMYSEVVSGIRPEGPDYSPVQDRLKVYASDPAAWPVFQQVMGDADKALEFGDPEAAKRHLRVAARLLADHPGSGGPMVSPETIKAMSSHITQITSKWKKAKHEPPAPSGSAPGRAALKKVSVELGGWANNGTLPEPLRNELRNAQAAIEREPPDWYTGRDHLASAIHAAGTFKDGSVDPGTLRSLRGLRQKYDNAVAELRAARLEASGYTLDPVDLKSLEQGFTRILDELPSRDGTGPEGKALYEAIKSLRNDDYAKAAYFLHSAAGSSRAVDRGQAYGLFAKVIEKAAPQAPSPESRTGLAVLKQASTVVPGLLGGDTTLAWDGKMPGIFEDEDEPSLLADVDWNGHVRFQRTTARRMGEVLNGTGPADPTAFSVPLHEMIHAIIPKGEDRVTNGDKAALNAHKGCQIIEESMTELGTIMHADGYFDAIGIGSRPTTFLKTDENGHLIPNPDRAPVQRKIEDLVGSVQRRLADPALPHSPDQALITATTLSRLAEEIRQGNHWSAKDEMDSLRHLGWPEFSGDFRELGRLVEQFGSMPDSQHATVSEYARQIRTPDRIRDGNVWGHYPEWTARAYEWLDMVAQMHNGAVPDDMETIKRLSDELNRVGTAAKPGVMADHVIKGWELEDKYAAGKTASQKRLAREELARAISDEFETYDTPAMMIREVIGVYKDQLQGAAA